MRNLTDPGAREDEYFLPIRLNKLPYQTAVALLVPSAEPSSYVASVTPPQGTAALAAAFHLSKAKLDRIVVKLSLFSERSARLKVAIYTGRRGTTCEMSSGLRAPPGESDATAGPQGRGGACRGAPQRVDNRGQGRQGRNPLGTDPPH
ncbi:hypothetical protein ACMD2_23014, partial [Ananas comosus]